MARYKIQNKTTLAKRRGKFRSILESDVNEALKNAGLDVRYEPYTIPYIVPIEKKRYTPDFVLKDSDDIVIESKGLFVASDRKKMLLLKEQYPEKTFILVFGNARAKIGKGKRSLTYAQWAEKHGFLWCDFYKSGLNKEWFNDL